MTCCAGWCVPIDSITESKYRSLPGLEGIAMHINLGHRDGMTVFNPQGGHCHYHTKEGLCAIELKHGEGYLSHVCALYPRIFYNFGIYAEESLDLSCPESAKIFLNADTFEYTDAEELVEYPRYGTNEDMTYMSLLLKLRELIVAYLREDANDLLPIVFRKLFVLGELLQDIFIREKIDPVTKEFSERIINETNRVISSDVEPMYIDARATDRIVTGGFYHTKLKRTSPYLYKLCRLYFSEFDKLSIEHIDSIYKDNIYQDEEINALIRKYLSYKIQLNFLETFEDYCFTRKVMYPVFQTHILGLMLYLNKKNLGKLTLEDTVLTISSVERRTSHREEFNSNIFNTLYAEL